LTKLQNGQSEFDFVGITSNGIDCIYFMPEKDRFNIDFEVVAKDQLPYVDKLKVFAEANKFKTSVTTYGNKPNFQSGKPAPVIHLKTNSSVEEVAKLAEKIQSEVFRNNRDTVYEIVP